MRDKKNKKIKIWPFVLGFFGALCVMAVAAFMLCRTRGYEIEGNSYYSDNTITTWVENDKLSFNTLFILAKYNLTDPELPAGVERLHVSLKNPWTVRIKVEEKELAGYVAFEDANLYFDSEGTAVLRSKKVIEGVPYIEGLAFDAATTEVGKPLPVEDDGIFGLKTKAAVEQFQEEYGLPVTGEISFQAILQAMVTPSPMPSLAPSPSPVAEDWPVTVHAPDGEDGVDLQLASTIGLCLGAIVCVCILVERLVAKASKMRFKRPSSDFILHLMVLLISIAAVVWFVADNSSLPDGASYIDVLLGLTMCIGCGIVHEIIVLREIIQRGKQK